MSKKKNRSHTYQNNRNSTQSNNTKSQDSSQLELDQTLNYAANFAKIYLTDNLQLSDPYLRNMILKNTNMNPRKQSKDKILELMEKPEQHEKTLRDFALYLENTVMQFRRLVDFFGSILSFDYFIEPTNADEEDMKSSPFKKSHKKAVDWLDRFDPKRQLPAIMKQILRQEVVYCYVRESKDNIFLQEMPIDYCKIISKTEYGYQYAFDMSYFFQLGTNIENYDPIFKDYLEKYKQNETKYNGKSAFWIELDPIKAPCFKFDETVAGTVPPFMAMFPDSLDIADYRELTKTKGQLDLYKFIINRIPVHGGDGKSRKANDLAIDANMAGTFSKVIESKVSEQKNIKSITTPFESEIVDFQRTENGNSEVDTGNRIFSNSTGVNPNVFGGNATTASSIGASLENAASFVSHMYPIFERFINVHLKATTGRYRWKVHFEGTRYDREERMDRAFKAAGGGFPKTFVAMAMGYTLETVANLTNLENSLDITGIMIPLQSSHVQNGKENGRPTKTSVGDEGEKTRDSDANVR